MVRKKQISDQLAGSAIMQLIEQLYPICRSITGDGVRQSLRILQAHIPLKIEEIPTGTKVLDWSVPKEWNIRSAWIKDPDGKVIVDFAQHNLHLLNYSIPIHVKVELALLKQHLYTLPAYPDWIPYRTSYYQENWGFCMSHRQMEQLKEGIYEVFIDSCLEDGALTFGELCLPGESEEEVLLSTHICHPSLANDNLSGIAVLTALAQRLIQRQHRYTYRFLFIPGTIGAISWLALNKGHVKQIRHGLVTALLGDDGDFTYKKSRRNDAEIDQVVAKALEDSGYLHQIIDFYPYGYDERQFCSPGFDLPVGNLGRTPYGQFPEYHSSADNLDFINADNLQTSLQLFSRIIDTLEQNRTYRNLQPFGEPQLGRRGLYEAIGGENDSRSFQMALLWVLNQSDGKHSLLDIARRAAMPFEIIARAATALEERELLERVEA